MSKREKKVEVAMERAGGGDGEAGSSSDVVRKTDWSWICTRKANLLKFLSCKSLDDHALGVKVAHLSLSEWKEGLKNRIPIPKMSQAPISQKLEQSSPLKKRSNSFGEGDTKTEAVGQLEDYTPPPSSGPPPAKRDLTVMFSKYGDRRIAGTPILPGDTVIEPDGRLEDFPPPPPPSPLPEGDPTTFTFSSIPDHWNYSPGPIKFWCGNPVGDYDQDELRSLMLSFMSCATWETVKQPDGRLAYRPSPPTSLPPPSHPVPDPDPKSSYAFAETSKTFPYVTVPMSFEPYGHISLLRYPDYMVCGIEAALLRFNERNPGIYFKLLYIEESNEFPKIGDKYYDCSHHINFWVQSCHYPSAKVLFFAEGHFTSSPRRYSMTACCPVDPFKAGISNCQECRRKISAIRRGYPKHPDDRFYGAIGSQS